MPHFGGIQKHFPLQAYGLYQGIGIYEIKERCISLFMPYKQLHNIYIVLNTLIIQILLSIKYTYYVHIIGLHCTYCLISDNFAFERTKIMMRGAILKLEKVLHLSIVGLYP